MWLGYAFGELDGFRFIGLFAWVLCCGGNGWNALVGFVRNIQLLCVCLAKINTEYRRSYIILINRIVFCGELCATRNSSGWTMNFSCSMQPTLFELCIFIVYLCISISMYMYIKLCIYV